MARKQSLKEKHDWDDSQECSDTASIVSGPRPTYSLSSPAGASAHKRKRSVTSKKRSASKKANTSATADVDNLCPVCDDVCNCGTLKSSFALGSSTFCEALVLSSGSSVYTEKPRKSGPERGYRSESELIKDISSGEEITEFVYSYKFIDENRIISELAATEDPFRKIDGYLYSSEEYLSSDDYSDKGYEEDIESGSASDSDIEKEIIRQEEEMLARRDKRSQKHAVRPFSYIPTSFMDEFEAGVSTKEKPSISGYLSDRVSLFSSQGPNVILREPLQDPMVPLTSFSETEPSKTRFVKNLSSVDKETLLEALKQMSPEVADTITSLKKKAKKVEPPTVSYTAAPYVNRKASMSVGPQHPSQDRQPICDAVDCCQGGGGVEMTFDDLVDIAILPLLPVRETNSRPIEKRFCPYHRLNHSCVKCDIQRKETKRVRRLSAPQLELVSAFKNPGLDIVLSTPKTSNTLTSLLDTSRKTEITKYLPSDKPYRNSHLLLEQVTGWYRFDEDAFLDGLLLDVFETTLGSSRDEDFVSDDDGSSYVLVELKLS